MKAFELQGGFGINSLRVVERPRPQPQAGQVLIEWEAWSLNFRDLLMVKGLYNPRLKFPFTPLSDAAGRVVEVGSGVTRVKPGDRVTSVFMPGWIDGGVTEEKSRTALGGAREGLLAEFSVLEEAGVLPVPPHLSSEESATLPCAAVTAWHAVVTEGKTSSSDTVLVQGTGGVSLFALQFARMQGAKVIATSSSDAKLSQVLDMGAAEGINYRTTPEWGSRALELTSKRGVDHVVEVGGAGTLGQSLRAVRMGGRISLIGVLAGGVGGQDQPVSLVPILMKGIRVQGIFVGSLEMFEAMNAAITLHQLRPVVDRVFAFEDFPAALHHMESAGHFGKIVVQKPTNAKPPGSTN